MVKDGRVLEDLSTVDTFLFDKTGRKIWQVPGYADPTIMIPYIKFIKGLDDGTYKSTKGKFYRVYILLKKIDTTLKINQLQFEEE